MRAKSFSSQQLVVDPSTLSRSVRNLCRRRSGKVLVLLGISVPAIFGLIGLVFDIGLHSIDNQNLKQAADAAATLQGEIYAKWGHISFIGALSNYDISFTAGTVSFVTVLGMTISPSTLLDPAKDVYLVE
jgi:hypothetical protein